jgi:hypothetical protein
MDDGPLMKICGLYVSSYESTNWKRLYAAREDISMNALFSDSAPKITLNPAGNEPVDVCIANISPKERQKRLRFAIVQFALSIVILAVLLLFGVDKLWRLTLYFMFAASASSFFQWRDKT